MENVIKGAGCFVLLINVAWIVFVLVAIIWGVTRVTGLVACQKEQGTYYLDGSCIHHGTD